MAVMMKYCLVGEIKAGEMEGPCGSSEVSEKCVQTLVGMPERRGLVVGVRNILMLIVEGTA
jgi:hypothetical protein